MKLAGIICECNPLHAGHEYLIRRAKAAGADGVVCLMSGAFVQRGEPAIVSARIRAESLLRCGADAVLELPFPYSAASAEFFAAAGVSILSRLGVQELWFGSECGDIDLLSRLASLAESPEFQETYAKAASGNRGTAEAFFEALAKEGDVPLASACSPNNILAISYLRAILRQRAEIRPVTVTRQGNGYRDTTLSSTQYPSATALRALWRAEGVEAVLPHLPKACRDCFASADTAPPDWKYAERLILGHFRLTAPTRLERFAELHGGLGARMSCTARDAVSLEDFLSRSATKKYPHARLRRAILFALTEVTDTDLRTPPAYVRLLAANTVGCSFLARSRRESSIPVVTRRTDLPSDPAAQHQAALEERAVACLSYCFPSIANDIDPWTQAPLILKNEKIED